MWKVNKTTTKGNFAQDILQKKKKKLRESGMDASVLMNAYQCKKMKFSIKISSVNVTKSAVSGGFGHIY